jgi:hypothetical protein
MLNKIISPGPLGATGQGTHRKTKLIMNKNQGASHTFFFKNGTTDPNGIKKQLNFWRKTNNVPIFIRLLLFIFKIPNNTSV